MADDKYPSETEPKGEVTDNDDGSVTVALEPPPEDIPEEAYNLVPHYNTSDKGKKFLKELADKVIKEFDEDWESCSAWRKKREQRWKLLIGDLSPKTFPFTECANVHIPVMLERSLRLVHRLYAEIFPDRDYIFSALPSNNLTQERADIVTQHQNLQFRKEIPDFFKQNRRALMEFIVHGDCIFFSSRDIPGKRNKHEALNCEEVVFPYVWKTTTIDMSDMPRKTRILRKFKHELKELERKKVYADVDIIFEKEKDPKFETGIDFTVRPTVDKFEGREAPASGGVAPYTLYEYHGWCKLPGQEDERPIVAVVESQTRTVTCLFIREEEDWKDAARFASQEDEMSGYNQAMQLHDEMVMKEQQITGRLLEPDVPMEEAMALQQKLAESPPQKPIPPAWMKDPMMPTPEPVRVVPIEYFSHGVCIENMDGSMGLGIGLLLEEFNKAANTAASQFTDSATLANVATVIMPDSVKMDAGENRLVPGEVHRVRGLSAEQINNAFKVIQFPQANPQLMEIVRLMLESADGVSSAPDVLSGEAGKANETFRGISTRIEQATKQLTVLAQNYLEMLSNVIRNNARLNAAFMEDIEIKSVIDPRTLEQQELEIDRQLYSEDFDISFTADIRFSGRAQKISEADQVIGMVGGLPPELAQLIFPPSFAYEAVSRALKARGLHDMVRFLGPRPPVPEFAAGQAPPPPGMPPGMPGMPPGAPPPGGPPPGGPPPGIPGPQVPPPE